MFSETPWILIAIVGILILLLVSVFFVANHNQISGTSFFTATHQKAFMFQFITGLLCILFGAFLMFNGELFGDNTTGIARIVGIIGICLIATASPIGMALKKRS